MLGSYILFMELSKENVFQIGKKGYITFPAAWYVYVGSAMNGIQQRVKRHLSKSKKKHWHIDYFLENVKIHQIFVKESKMKEECVIAQQFAEIFDSIPSFGSSDCSCESHLFFGEKRKLEETCTMAHMKLLNEGAQIN